MRLLLVVTPVRQNVCLPILVDKFHMHVLRLPFTCSHVGASKAEKHMCFEMKGNRPHEHICLRNYVRHTPNVVRGIP